MKSLAKHPKSESKKWHQASLRIFSPDLDPDSITGMLKIQPSRIGIKGAHYAGNPAYGKHKKHMWCLDLTKDSSQPFQTQLSKALKRFAKSKPSIMALSSRRNTKVEFFLGFASENGQGGCEFAPELLKEIAEWGIHLSFDLFPPDIRGTT